MCTKCVCVCKGCAFVQCVRVQSMCSVRVAVYAVCAHTAFTLHTAHTADTHSARCVQCEWSVSVRVHCACTVSVRVQSECACVNAVCDVMCDRVRSKELIYLAWDSSKDVCCRS
jgi:hypothetical protein